MKTCEDLAAKAREMELVRVNFRKANGEYARKRRAIDHAEFVFADGDEFVLPKAELGRPMFDEITFRLRPGVNH